MSSNHRKIPIRMTINITAITLSAWFLPASARPPCEPQCVAPPIKDQMIAPKLSRLRNHTDTSATPSKPSTRKPATGHQSSKKQRCRRQQQHRGSTNFNGIQPDTLVFQLLRSSCCSCLQSILPFNGRPGGNRTPNLRFWRPLLCQLSYWPINNYSIIFATTPAPTVRPPSRIAKRRPSSMAIGAISVTTICTLSPGITISTPSGRSTAPVTSVVRK